MTEAELQIQVADYLRLQYPNVLFHSDFGSGIKLTPGQAIKQKRQNGGRRAWPDMFIAEPSYVKDDDVLKDDPALTVMKMKHGLLIELKREGTRLKKKNGEWASEHIREQAEVLEQLLEKGYAAKFACGFDEAKAAIDDYLSDS